MNGTVGEVIKRKGDQTVQLIRTACGKRYYLKRCGAPSLRRALSALRRGKRPYSDSYSEYLAARSLEEAGFRVMRVVMAGERRLFGIWPTHGFLLARQVRGAEMIKALASAEGAQAVLLWRAIGRLLGRLHHAGFYPALRLHDLFVSDADAHQDGVPDPTIIDPDFKGAPTEPRPYSIELSVECMAQCLYVFLRCGHRLAPRFLRALHREYRATLRRLLGRRCTRMAGAVNARLRAKFAAHFANPAVVSTFKDAPSQEDALSAPLAHLLAPQEGDFTQRPRAAAAVAPSHQD